MLWCPNIRCVCTRFHSPVACCLSFVFERATVLAVALCVQMFVFSPRTVILSVSHFKCVCCMYAVRFRTLQLFSFSRLSSVRNSASASLPPYELELVSS